MSFGREWDWHKEAEAETWEFVDDVLIFFDENPECLEMFESRFPDQGEEK